MTLADDLADRFTVRFAANGREAFLVSQAGPFTGLNETDGQILSDWVAAARKRGIDTAMDLTVRPWNIAGALAIVGVFETNRPDASWLIVRSRDGWLLARCDDGTISEVAARLPDVLALLSRELPG